MTGRCRARRAVTVTSYGLVLAVRVAPGAAANRIGPIESRPDAGTVLRIAIAAPPERGKANRGLVAFLAKALRVPKSAVAIAAGDRSRTKTIEISGDPEELALRIENLLA